MKAVIDTNVFVSGIFWKGPPHQILKAWQKGKFTLVISPSILGEYQRVLAELSSKYGTSIQYDRILDLVSVHADVVPAISFPQPICRDPDDDKFIATAFSAKAEFIVTGDKALLELNGFQEIKVVTASVFLKQLS